MDNQNNSNGDRAAEKRAARLEEELNAELNIKLLRRELIFINNVLVATPFKLGDAAVALDIFSKLQPFVKTTNDPIVEDKKPVVN